MALTPRLDLRQSQSLVMTPQLQQAIKLLQLNNLELAAFLERELEQNPLLDREGDAPGEEPAPAPESRGGDEPILEAAVPGEAEAPLDVDYDNAWSGNAEPESEASLGAWTGSGGRHDFDDSAPDLERTLAGGVSLRDHLREQIGLAFATPAERLIGFYLMEMLDESGYLTGDLDEAAVALGCSRAGLDAVLARLQRLDPPGIFARSLAECLALQLAERDRLDPAMQALLDNLDRLARRDLAGLMRLCGVDGEDMAAMIAEIRALNPRPASVFDDSVAQPVVPDVLMRARPDGAWDVELNADTLPRLLVDMRYYARVAGAARSREEKTYVSERLQAANWLVKSLHQRATTILKVASEIVRQQDGFFRKGIAHLRPLVLRDVALAIGMHESTVSRVTANKYIATPRGIFELKYFFTQAIAATSGGATHSAESVRHRIRALIDAEAADAVLSDDRIVEILRAEGVDIARRTVAKYRESMRIGSSVQRRREKLMGV